MINYFFFSKRITFIFAEKKKKKKDDIGNNENQPDENDLEQEPVQTFKMDSQSSLHLCWSTISLVSQKIRVPSINETKAKIQQHHQQ